MEENQVYYDDYFANGMILPEELLIEIFKYSDLDVLANCESVCKRWKFIIDNFTWPVKAEMVLGRSLRNYTNIPWYYYKLISHGIFERNLIKNHSGELQFEHWRTPFPADWTVENPAYPDLPNDRIFEGKKHCFVTPTHVSFYEYTVNLVEIGFPTQFLDQVRPPIEVKEWYYINEPNSFYSVNIILLDDSNNVIDQYEFSDDPPRNELHDNNWNYMSYVFNRYESGLREIKFSHSGVYYCKLAGASVKLMIPNEFRRQV